MALDPISSILDIGGKVIDKIFPDKNEALKAKTQLLTMQQAGELDELKTVLEVFVAEAKSTDPWTSRARPSFFYVMYIMILFGIPMGVLCVFNPSAAIQIATGMKAWLAAIPDTLWAVFGAGFSVYTVTRSVFDKRVSNGKYGK